MLTAERLTDPVAYHGEGPFWDERGDRLLCLDVLRGAIVDIRDDGQVLRHQLPSPVVTAIRRRTSGGFVLATERGVVVTDDQFSVFEEIARLTGDPQIRANDGGCDHSGSFVIGTMAYDERPGGGALYRVTPEHQVEQVLSSVSISNGVQWSGDGMRAYYIDSPTRRVDVFDIDAGTGAWSNGRPHICVEESVGVPDGMAIDEDGGLWVALWGGGAINHYDADGGLVERVVIPGVSQVSSCAFGGRDRDVLYVTTSGLGLPARREKDAGSVFAVQTLSRGAELARFAG